MVFLGSEELQVTDPDLETLDTMTPAESDPPRSQKKKEASRDKETNVAGLSQLIALQQQTHLMKQQNLAVKHQNLLLKQKKLQAELSLLNQQLLLNGQLPM